MKKFIISLFICLFLFPIVVNSKEYKLNQLIEKEEQATVATDKFIYNNFKFDSNGLIDFESIKNLTISKTPISINVLLFDGNKKNIGLVAYCTDKDFSSDYSGFKLSKEEELPFSINVTSKYFVDGKSIKDVQYIAVMDENKYCHIGGYTNYKDLTIEEIVSGDTIKKQDIKDINSLISYIKENNLLPIIIIVAGSIICLIIIIMVVKTIINIKRNKPIPYEKTIDEPVEKTIDLSYDSVDTIEDNQVDDVISMGINNNSIDDDNDNEENNENDLTKFFK